MRLKSQMRVKAYGLATLLALGTMGASAQTSSATGDSAPPVIVRAPAGPARVSSGVMANLVQHKVDPIYPEEAKAKGISGAVVVHVIIDPQGKVDKLSAIIGPGPLRDAAVTAVKQWTYKPYLLNGGPVSVETIVTVNFTPAP
jgi:periplasmic protein TonB